LSQRHITMSSRATSRTRPAVLFLTLLLAAGVVGWLATARATATGAALPPPSAPAAPKSPATPQSGPPILVSHVTWQGRPAQPNNLQRLPVTLTLELSGTAFLYPNLVTDASGAFTVTLGSLPTGAYNWWVKGPQYLAKGGVVQLAGAPVTNAEMGILQVGDANTDNLVDIADFGIVRASFGKSLGDTGYDQRADFNGDNTVDIVDFSLMRGNFGSYGPVAPPNAAPPDPSVVAPPVDMTVATNLGTATEFLYTGPSPIQSGVVSGTIEITRVAVLRGKVLNRANEPLPAVTITVLGHPEFGQTLSRADGMFDMAVNGGGLLTVEYAKSGYLPVQRDVEAPWKDYEWLPDVVMVPLDLNVTVINLPSGTPMQVARGSVISDTDGVRQQTLMFPMNATAVMTLPTGITQTLTTLHVRSTEYTVGANGPGAMPGDLPPNSGYTYAVEFSVDEAIAVGAKGVGFSQPIIGYLENFLSFDVGGIVPSGFYDRTSGQWIPSPNGRVITILSITGNLADLDTDGDGIADNGAELGITNAERQRLADLYQPGQSLWRTPMDHFSAPDWNWPYGAGEGAGPYQGEGPFYKNMDDPCQKTGWSIIGCESQTLGEAVSIAGTEFNLHYQSDRVAGRQDAYNLPIQVSASTVPTNLEYIRLEVLIGGRTFIERFSALPNQSYNFTWDGKDAYGRILQGGQPVTVRIGYVYLARYMEPNPYSQAFGAYSVTPLAAGEGQSLRLDIVYWKEWKGYMGKWLSSAQGMGSWSLDVHHVYDPSGKVLYLGDGTQRSAEPQHNKIITTVAGGGNGGDGGPATEAYVRPTAVDAGPDGSLYVADFLGRIRRVWPNGIITTVAGRPSDWGYSGDGGPATQAQLGFPQGVALAPDGSLYIADTWTHRIRRVAPNGIITTVAGTGTFAGPGGYSGDGGPATAAQLNQPRGIAIGPDGSLYIADRLNNRIRRVDTDGIITTIAGNGTGGIDGDSGPAAQATLFSPAGVAVGPDGSIYSTDTLSNDGRVRRIGTDGIITTVAGGGNGGDGDPATQAFLSSPSAIDIGPDGSLYIVAEEGYNFYSLPRIRYVGPDGVISTIAGSGLWGYSGDGSPARRAQFHNPSGVALGPDSSVYIADQDNYRVRRMGLSNPDLSISDLIFPAEDGSEVYIFNGFGKHLRTLDALTGAVRYQFGYGPAGRLSSVTDGHGNVTTIEHDGNGNPTAIVAPDGQRTILTVNANGYLASITNPANEVVQLGYSPGGLLTSMTDPRNGSHHYYYDALGRLTRDENAADGSMNLARVDNGNVYTVTVTTAMSRTTTYRVEDLPTGDRRRVNTDPNGLRSESLRRTDGTLIFTDTNGTIIEQVLGPDPRWGMLAPLVTNTIIRTPGGLVATHSMTRIVRLSDPNNKWSMQAMTNTVTINGRTSTSVYDAATRTILGTTATGRQASVTLNIYGDVTRMQTAGLDPLTVNYDSRGRVISTSMGTGTGARSTSMLYDGAGYVGTITDPISSTLRFGYDAVGRVLTQTLEDGRIIRFGYDAASNLTRLTPPGRPGHNFTYTPADLQEDYIPPDVGAGTNLTHYTYNLDKHITQIARPDGATINQSYDSGGRPSTLTFPQGTITTAYDSVTGNLTGLTAPGWVTTSYTYDGALITGNSWSGPISGTVGFVYDNDLRVSSQTINGANPVSYQYDADSSIVGVGPYTLSRSPQNGLLTGSTLNSITDTLVYNSFGEPTRYTAAAGGSNTLFSVQHTRDKLGRISERTETITGVTHIYSYTYDLSGRLTDVRRDGAVISNYGYDSNDNRTNYTGPSGTIIGTYDVQDRLLQYGTTTYSYTANGELLSKVEQSQMAPGGSSGKQGVKTGAQTTYSYDVLGNLKAATLSDGTQIEYIVDGQNRRIGKKINGTLVQGFLYSGQLAPVAELDGSNNVVSRFVYATKINVPDYMIKNGVTYRIISDHVGSPRLVVNTSTGQVVQRMEFDEFGKVLTDTNPGLQPFGFAGGLYDRHTNLTRFGARDYDAETGRWTAKDPIGLAGGGTNLYLYVLGDPINLIDPTGLFSFRKALSVVSVVTQVAAAGACIAMVGCGVVGGAAFVVGVVKAHVDSGGKFGSNAWLRAQGLNLINGTLSKLPGAKAATEAMKGTAGYIVRAHLEIAGLAISLLFDMVTAKEPEHCP
jgi:RHS repeat-associated protein